jgi:hypothetical protein
MSVIVMTLSLSAAGGRPVPRTGAAQLQQVTVLEGGELL